MPSWYPNLHDVEFDHAKAAAAIDALRATASLLDNQTDHRVRLATTAQRDWQGRARRTFDDELGRMARQAADLADACRRAAAHIATAADDARLSNGDGWISGPAGATNADEN